MKQRETKAVNVQSSDEIGTSQPDSRKQIVFSLTQGARQATGSLLEAAILWDRRRHLLAREAAADFANNSNGLNRTAKTTMSMF